MQVDVFQLYEQILFAQGISYIRFEPGISDFYLEDYGFRSRLFNNFSYRPYFDRILSKMNESEIVYFKDDFDLNYCFFLMPEHLQNEYHAAYILIGPVIFERYGTAQIQTILKNHKLPVRLTTDTMEFYNRIPLLPGLDFFLSLLSPLLKALYPKEMRLITIPFSSEIPSYETAPILQEEDRNISFEALEQRYKEENAMLHAVSTGNMEAALAAHHRFMQYRMNQRVPDPIRDAKNGLLIFNTILRRSLESAQVHPYYIDEISNFFAIQIENTDSRNRLNELSVQMIRKYTMLVHNYSTKGYSGIVSTCMDQIRFHYAETINLDVLSRKCAVSPNYLSSRFHQETGMTISEFLQGIRLEQAIQLLNTEDLSIQQIADKCGFQDSNYFIRVFKKSRGISPNQYRKQIHSHQN